MIKRDAAYYGEIQQRGVPPELLKDVLNEHAGLIGRYNRLDNYYNGRHDILARPPEGEGRPNVRIMFAYPKYIVTMTTGYLLGDKVKYSNDKIEGIGDLTDKYNKSQFWGTDEEIAKDMAIFGRGCELLYMSGDEKPLPKSANLDPRNAFVVYTDTIDSRRMFGVYYFTRKDTGCATDKTIVHIYTARHIYTYETTGPASGGDYSMPVAVEEHYFGDVPLVEYENNEEARGDFEDVMGLVDAYNQLQSDRVNDVERFVRAILFLKNFTLDEADAAMLKHKRILQASGSETDARWLVNALDQSGAEILRRTIEDDISKFSFVPNMNDENFANNVSGVAMKYKLIGLSQMTKIKKRYMEKGLRERLKMVVRVPNWVNHIDPDEITIEFTHSLPVNDLETAQMVQSLKDMVSDETLLGQISFVSDPAAEAMLVSRQKDEEVKRSRDAYSFPFDNGEPDGGIDI